MYISPIDIDNVSEYDPYLTLYIHINSSMSLGETVDSTDGFQIPLIYKIAYEIPPPGLKSKMKIAYKMESFAITGLGRSLLETVIL